MRMAALLERIVLRHGVLLLAAVALATENASSTSYASTIHLSLPQRDTNAR